MATKKLLQIAVVFLLLSMPYRRQYYPHTYSLIYISPRMLLRV